jgi:ribosomal protein S18 acetylase RimI-like enzyme
MSYDRFEELIYDMRHMEYKMLGVFEQGELVSYGGVAIQTTLTYKRHLAIFEFGTKKTFQNRGYGTMLMEYLQDYAKMGMCEVLLLHCNTQGCMEFFEKFGFKKGSVCYVAHP